jgi:hypothetical protein
VLRVRSTSAASSCCPVPALAKPGRVQEAGARLNRLCAGLPRLLAEEGEPQSGRMLGYTRWCGATPNWRAPCMCSTPHSAGIVGVHPDGGPGGCTATSRCATGIDMPGR